MCISLACPSPALCHEQADTALEAEVAGMAGDWSELRLIRLDDKQNALELWEPICYDNPHPLGPTLLLLPPGYELLDEAAGPRELLEILYVGMKVRAHSTSRSHAIHAFPNRAHLRPICQHYRSVHINCKQFSPDSNTKAPALASDLHGMHFAGMPAL